MDLQRRYRWTNIGARGIHECTSAWSRLRCVKKDDLSTLMGTDYGLLLNCLIFNRSYLEFQKGIRMYTLALSSSLTQSPILLITIPSHPSTNLSPTIHLPHSSSSPPSPHRTYPPLPAPAPPTTSLQSLTARPSSSSTHHHKHSLLLSSWPPNSYARASANHASG